MDTSTRQQDAQPRPKLGWGWGLALLLVIAAWGYAIAVRSGGVQVLAGWEEGLDAGQAKAAQLDRPMVILFTASWCGPCQLLKHEVLTRPEVVEVLSRDFVPVYVDMTTAGHDDKRLMQYRIMGYPTVIVISQDGSELQRIEGLNNEPASSAQAFINWLDRARGPGAGL